jgi:hypothetical protein
MEASAGRTTEELLDWPSANREVVALGLEWLARCLEREITGLRRSAPPEAFVAGNAAAMSDLAADWLLRSLSGGTPENAMARDTDDAAESAAVAFARRAYEGRREEMVDAGRPASIDSLSRTFALTAFDEDVLLLALAPRMEARFQALYGYLHDRLSLTTATRHLALRLLVGRHGGFEARQLAEGRLSPDAPLRRYHLVQVAQASEAGALAAVTLDERMADYLIGYDRLEPRVRACLRPLTRVSLPSSREADAAGLGTRLARADRPAALLLGPQGSGRRALAWRLAESVGLGLVELVAERWLAASALGGPGAEGFDLLAREAALGRFAILIDAGQRASEGSSPSMALAERALEALAAAVLVVAQDRPRLAPGVPTLSLLALGDAERGEIWKDVLGARAPGTRDIEALAAQFRIGPQKIAEVGAEIIAEGGGGQAEPERLWRGCREVSEPALAGLVQRLAPRFTWDDLVLPAPVAADLVALAGQLRARATVLGRWGFARRWNEAGANALFAGPSGTGKSMAAEVIAGSLGLDLYRIDLSGVVNKYIGETEKNLRRIFEAAEASGAVLLFDEADALFGKRSEVKDSHDRYANIEVSYLLQAMESYRGLAILSTNMKNHIDQAFLRRLAYVIDFAKPDREARRRIWQLCIPDDVPLEDVDFDRLAKLEVAGGSIARIALNAAYLAADQGEYLAMAHLFRAAAAEYRKMDQEFRAP